MDWLGLKVIGPAWGSPEDWRTWHGYMQLVLDLGMFIVDWLLAQIFYVSARRLDWGKFGKTLNMMAFFMFCLGASRLVEAIIFYWPAYYLFLFSKVFALLAGMITFYYVLPNFVEHLRSDEK